MPSPSVEEQGRLSASRLRIHLCSSRLGTVQDDENNDNNDDILAFLGRLSTSKRINKWLFVYRFLSSLTTVDFQSGPKSQGRIIAVDTLLSANLIWMNALEEMQQKHLFWRCFFWRAFRSLSPESVLPSGWTGNATQSSTLKETNYAGVTFQEKTTVWFSFRLALLFPLSWSHKASEFSPV